MKSGDQEEAIAQYLTRRMSEVERSAFEQKISESPQLAQKIEFEKQIAQGIKNYKKGILKSRLDQLELGPSIVETTSITTKTILAGITVIVIGGLSYFMLTPGEILVIENQETIIGTDGMAEDKNAKISLEIDTTYAMLSDKKEDERTSPITKDIENTTVKVSTKQSKKESKSDKVILQAEVEVVLPDMDGTEISFDETFDSLQDFSDDLMKNQAQVSSVPELEVEIEMKKTKKLKYIYVGEKLILIGDFSASPYQIIEDNTIAEKKLYLYFEQEYYVLSVTSEKKVLIPVRDIRLLDYLVDLRNK
ncbi:MAG: hypothetical protein ACKVLJ_04205 [Cytophagales bacterium]|jgi:hypothetical protein|tara:strand:- start:40 stop:957 length:918 start_codon:yes stop_codon:yes gene_type:complete